MKGPLLVVPALEKGRGGGHLVRSLELVYSLRSQNQEAYCYIPGSGEAPHAIARTLLSPRLELDPSWFIPDERSLKALSWECIILDRFKTPPREFAQWSALAPLIGIDEGGSLRGSVDFLIDLLPNTQGSSPPNILAPNLLPLPKNRRSSFYLGKEDRPLKILVSFGAEDPGNLTLPVCLAIASPEHTEITALFGGLNRLGDREPFIDAGVQVLEGIPELREHLAAYDLVITHFGLTAFECIYARVPALLVSPGAYHEKLACHAGFISAGIGSRGAYRIRGLLYKKPSIAGGSPGINHEFLNSLGKEGEALGIRYGLQGTSPLQSLGVFLGKAVPHFPLACPSCGSQTRFKHPVLARFQDRTYRRCSHCGMVYMLRPAPPAIEYEEDYFFAFYKKQYGKTYLEDFPNLIKNGKARLKQIQTLLCKQGKGLQLLDIGCAYGPFLVAAREEGFSPTGIDPAEDAIRYVRGELKIPGFQGFFPDTPLPDIIREETFEVVSLWYVIEHFKNPAGVLQEIHRLLKPGGVLAFSTPSFSGISGRVSAQGFLKKSPGDHWTVWEPRYTPRILRKYGFTLKKMIVSGHHPERFPLFGRFLNPQGKKLYTLFLWISRLFRLGDTFEVYAIRD